MNNSDQNIAINSNSLTIRTETNQIEIKQNDKVLYTIIGITLFPEHVKVEPYVIKNKLIKKSETIDKEFGIENKLHNGEYFVNIIDYNLGEVSIAANFLTKQWSKLIWQLLIASPEKKGLKVTLNDSAIKNQLLKANPDLFKSISDIDHFCQKYNLDIQQFAVSANFSQLDIDLQGVSTRLSREIVFFRRKMFTELLIIEIDKKIQNCKDLNIPSPNMNLYRNWKSKELDKIDEIQKYIKSPFTFDSNEQFDYYLNPTNPKPDFISNQDLISECNFWIKDFSKAKKRFVRAVELFREGKDYRDSIDNLRLTLELLLKELLGNEKSLEKQIEDIGKYLAKHRIGKEIRNMFQKILNYYVKFQNERVKHDDDLNSINDVEFVFSLSMIFIRVLIKSNNELTVTQSHKTLYSDTSEIHF